MKRTGLNALKLETFLDVFTGTCDLNNYKEIMGISLDNLLVDNELAETGKYYTYSLNQDKLEFACVTKGFKDVYRDVELINLASKILNNAGIYDLIIRVNSNNQKLIDMLDSIDLAVESTDSNKSGLDLSFEIEVSDGVAVKGERRGEVGQFTIIYEAFEDLLERDNVNGLNAYIMPKNEKVLEDALLLSTNLKDSGFVIETDYDLKGEIPEFTDYLISFDEKDISDYKVKLKDLKTNEEREIMIDNLIEELSFM